MNTGQTPTSEASNPFGPDKMTQVSGDLHNLFLILFVMIIMIIVFTTIIMVLMMIMVQHLQSDMGGEPTGKETSEQNGPLPSFAKYNNIIIVILIPKNLKSLLFFASSVTVIFI